MNDLFQNLKNEFQNEDFRYAYAESFLNTKLAMQIKTLREQRKKTQTEIAETMGIKQPGYRRFEDVNHSVWKTDSLWAIARALGVRLNISFETFGTLPEQKRSFNKESLKLPEFKDDPAFKDRSVKFDQVVAHHVVTQAQTTSYVAFDFRTFPADYYLKVRPIDSSPLYRADQDTTLAKTSLCFSETTTSVFPKAIGA